MAWIRTVPDDEVPEDCRVSEAHIVRVSAVSPQVMPRHMELYTQIQKRRGPLSRAQRETIAVVVSAVNGCHY